MSIIENISKRKSKSKIRKDEKSETKKILNFDRNSGTISIDKSASNKKTPRERSSKKKEEAKTSPMVKVGFDFSFADISS